MAATASLPEDIMLEILLRVPVESLIRFKLVSKSWYSLISNRQFIKLRLRQSVESNNDIDHLFVIEEGLSSEYVIKSSNNFYEITGSDNWYQHHPYLNRNRYSILCSCDGLLMIREITGANKQELFPVIWNPTTGESRELPVLNTDFCFKIPYGLGYDWSTDDYKMVYGAYADEARDKINLMVFSLKSSISWRESQVFDYTISVTSNERGSHVNGVLYWLGCGRSTSRKCLIGFELAEEKILELPLPADEERFEYRVLGDMKGRLCLSQSVSYSAARIYSLTAWLMKEDNGAAAASWIKFISFPQILIGNYEECFSFVRVFCFSKEAVFVMAYSNDDSGAIVIDIEKQKFVGARRFKGPSSRRIFALLQSLVSPK